MLGHLGHVIGFGSLNAACMLSHVASRCITSSAARSSLAAVEKLYKELEGKKALPWENPVTPEEASNVLGKYCVTWP